MSFALDSDPTTRPAMSDILSHPYIAGTEEEYPTSSLGELVRIYYQWSQRGGQRISLFHPGGAAAAQFPGEDYADEDWNFSTTDGFERRFSVLDLDQLAASLAELEREMNPATPEIRDDKLLDPVPTEMNPDEKANFDERVRRGATAMEGLFDEKKPNYKYETKSDFVPVQEKQTSTDLPLRTVTDRSSVASTLIDIDIGSFDSAHYAAASASAQPFQLADANTIRANRSSGRQHRNSNEERTQSSNEDKDDSQDLTYQPQSGPRPPTMEWKFPSFMPTTEEKPEEESELDSKSKPTESELTKKRATMEWTFPMMGATPEENQEPVEESNVNDTIRPPATAVRSSTASSIGPIDLGEPGDARPSTPSASSQSDQSDSEYDPFRFDRPITPRSYKSPQQDNLSTNEIHSSLNSVRMSNYETPVLDGPGPDEEDTHPFWQTDSIIEDPASHAEPFPTGDMEMPSEASSPIPESLSTARRPPTEPVEFPTLAPPSLESLTEGADDAVVTAELDRLLGDLLGSLKLTGDALAKVNVGPEKADTTLISENSE